MLPLADKIVFRSAGIILLVYVLVITINPYSWFIGLIGLLVLGLVAFFSFRGHKRNGGSSLSLIDKIILRTLVIFLVAIMVGLAFTDFGFAGAVLFILVVALLVGATFLDEMKISIGRK